VITMSATSIAAVTPRLNRYVAAPEQANGVATALIMHEWLFWPPQNSHSCTINNGAGAAGVSDAQPPSRRAHRRTWVRHGHQGKSLDV